MIKRYLLTFMGFFILATGYLFTLLPLLMVRSGLSNQTYLEALAVWGVLVLLSLGPAVSFLLRKIWFFEGTEQSVSLEKLRSTLLEVNKMHETKSAKGWNIPENPGNGDRKVIGYISRLHLL